MKSYSSRQLEIGNLLTSAGKDGMTADLVDQVLAMVEHAEKSGSNATAIKASENSEALIRMKIIEETDWRKKASLCALLISRSLE